MTLSSSVGWPLNGPILSVRQGAVGLLAEDEGQQQQADPGRRPGVLVATQPGVRADDDRQHADDRDGDQQPQQLDARPGRARRRSAEPARSWGSRSISSSPSPPSSPTAGSRTWSVRRPARTWATCAAARAPGRSPAGRIGGLDDQRAIGQERPGRPERDAARDQGDRRPGRSRPSSRRRKRGRIGPMSGRRVRGRAQRRSSRSRPARSSRKRTWPTWISSPKASRREPVDRGAVDEGPVGAVEVLEVPGPAAERQHGVLGAGERVVDARSCC